MKKILSCFLCCLLFFCGISEAVNYNNLNESIENTAMYIYNTVNNPQVGSIGGEWAILGLARSGVNIPEEYYENYYKYVEGYVKKCDGNLHDKKYTEYSRLIVTLTAIGKNPTNVAGYNLLIPLGDYEKTVWQGINGPVWALIALDSGNYEIPYNVNAETKATREMYINRILDYQLEDGGWALSGNISDPDITGMALQALSKYQNNEKVRQAINKAIECMSKKQDSDGGFSSWEISNVESSVQMLVALCELGISVDDARFVKNENTIFDNIMSYYDGGNGFKHTLDDKSSNQMATEQAFYGIVALKMSLDNKPTLYNMTDVIKISNASSAIVGLAEKHQDVKKMNIVNTNRTFDDIKEHKNKATIEALASRNIISGKTNNSFEPNSTMTRAEFATIIVKGLGLPIKNNKVFNDVRENDWFESFVNTAYFYDIIKGVSKTEFNPNGTITREEAAVMISKAAKLCGMNNEISTFEARNILAGFSDYVEISDWAFSSMAFCYEKEILSNDIMETKPKEHVTRAEIADMLYNMLDLANLL